MNQRPAHILAPAHPAERTGEAARALESLLATILSLLTALLGASHRVPRRLIAARNAVLSLLRPHPPGRARPPVPFTPELRRDLARLRAAQPIPVRPRRFVPSRAARRRAAAQWRLLFGPRYLHERYRRPWPGPRPARQVRAAPKRHLRPYARPPPTGENRGSARTPLCAATQRNVITYPPTCRTQSPRL